MKRKALLLALLLEVYKCLDFVDGIRLVMQTLGLSMLAYLLVAFTTRIYIGYIVLPVIMIILITHIARSTKQTKHINHSSKQNSNHYET